MKTNKWRYIKDKSCALVSSPEPGIKGVPLSRQC